MKLLIAGDLHGSVLYAEKLRALFYKLEPERLVLLGDLLYHDPREDPPEHYKPREVAQVLNGMRESILAVRGNCEAEVDQMVLEFPVLADYMVLFVDGIAIYACHGHQTGPHNPPPLHGGEVLLYGHTHIGAEVCAEGYHYINPGSLAMPKDGHHSYTLYEDGAFTRYDLQGNVLGCCRVKESTP